MDSKTIRTFFAISLPLQILKQVEKSVSGLKRSIPDHIKWVSVDSMHITLKFIGFFNPDHLSEIQEDLVKQLMGFGKINFSIGKPGVFPNTRNPKTVWLGLKEIDQIRDLVKIVDQSMILYGYGQEKRMLSPHLTIGRVRNNIGLEEKLKISQKVIDYEIPLIGPFIIDKLSFIKSDLTPRGAIYTMLFEIRL
jgi:2'-5' RNA ligase